MEMKDRVRIIDVPKSWGVRDSLLQAGSGMECRELTIPDSNLASETYNNAAAASQGKGDFERME